MDAIDPRVPGLQVPAVAFHQSKEFPAVQMLHQPQFGLAVDAVREHG